MDKSCEGCRFHTFPYKAQTTIKNIEGKFEQIKFKSKEDVWKAVLGLKKEAENNPRSTSRTIAKDVWYQIPFFACKNLFIDSDMQKDISKYLYCNDTKTPPYSGSHGEIPKIWLEKHFIIKQALSILYQDKKHDKKLKQGNNGLR